MNTTAIIQTRQDAQRALNQQPVRGSAVLLRGRWFVTRPDGETWRLHRESPHEDRMGISDWMYAGAVLDIVFGSK